MDNKDLLYSAGNYMQCLAMIYNGKESERIYSLSKSHVQLFGTPGSVACQASLKGEGHKELDTAEGLTLHLSYYARS